MRYLSQRGDFFYFLRRIPTHLQPQFGYRREMRLSLETRDRMTARKLVKQYDVEMDRLWVAARLKVSDEVIKGIISISRGKSEGRPEGAKRPTAGDEPREFTSRGEGGRVPPFFEKLPSKRLWHRPPCSQRRSR